MLLLIFYITKPNPIIYKAQTKKKPKRANTFSINEIYVCYAYFQVKIYNLLAQFIIFSYVINGQM